MRRKLGTILLSKQLIEKIAGDEGYYYHTCQIKLMQGEIVQMVHNSEVKWVEELYLDENSNFLNTANITLVRESESNVPGAYDIMIEIID